MENNISGKTVGRLSQYCRILMNLSARGETHVHSQTLAELAGTSAAQVRRDLMALDSVGTPVNGYNTEQLLQQLNSFFRGAREQRIALAGVGNLGRALLAYLREQQPDSPVLAAFDNDPGKVHKEIQGCTCYPASSLEEMARQLHITVGIIAVPADAAQSIAESFVNGGVRGLLNFAPTPLRVPSTVYIEYIDITMLLDKVAYFGASAEENDDQSRP